MILEDCSRHRRLLAAVDGSGGHAARRVHDVAEGHHARDHLLHTLEAADRSIELAPYARVGAGGEDRGQCAAGGVRGQGNTAADRQLLDQHAPAGSGLGQSADNAIERREYVMAAHRAVQKRNIERHVTPPDLDAGRVARQQCTGDADIDLVAEQMLRVEHPECQAYHGRHRCQGDVALGEVELQADDFAPLPLAATHHAGVRDRRCVGAHARAGECETGDFFAAREPRQVMVFLLLGAVV